MFNKVYKKVANSVEAMFMLSLTFTLICFKDIYYNLADGNQVMVYIDLVLLIGNIYFMTMEYEVLKQEILTGEVK